MKSFRILLIFLLKISLLGLGGIVFLEAQSDLLREKAELIEEIRRIRKEITEEKKAFENYLQQKENILSYKSEERDFLDKDIRSKSAEIRIQRRDLIQVESEILALENQGRKVTEKIRSFAVFMLEEIDRGIPFEQEKRKALLSSLIYDIDNSSISASESFSRFLSFLNLEQGMSYDSQVIRTTMEIGGSKKDVNLLRIGKVFMAVDDGKEVYLWKLQDGKYMVDEEATSSLNSRAVRIAVEIIQGKRVPELVTLPFPSALIEKGGTDESF